jgi:hypothetical protein
MPRGELGVDASFDDVRREAVRLVNAAEEHHLRVRLLGGVAVALEDEAWEIGARLGRAVPNDIDFVVVSEDRRRFQELIEARGYESDFGLEVATQGKRFSFSSRTAVKLLDVFVDELDMCHRLDLRRRIDVRPVALAPADLLLEKLQIVELTDKDIIDTVVVLCRYDFGDDESSSINLDYILSLLVDDWGFFHTVEQNLERIHSGIGELPLSDAEGVTVRARLETLRTSASSAPKTRRWRMRAKIGTKKRWYQDVDEVAAF